MPPPKADELVVAQCILCGGTLGGVTFPYGMRWSGRVFQYRRCQNCGSGIVDPMPTASDIEDMYRQHSYHSEHYADFGEEATDSQLLQVIGRFEPGASLLDFGCGNGTFLRLATAAGFVAEGVELDAEVRRIASANSKCAVFAFDELKTKDRRYDIIHLGDVLEHLPNPAEILSQLEQLLSPRGCFFLEGPVENNPSLVYFIAQLFGGLKRRLHRNLFANLPPFHLFRVDARAQRDFLEKSMHYQVDQFFIFETGWPYRLKNDRLIHPQDAAHFCRMMIGRFAVVLALAGQVFGLRLGNRFAVIARPSSKAI